MNLKNIWVSFCISGNFRILNPYKSLPLNRFNNTIKKQKITHICNIHVIQTYTDTNRDIIVIRTMHQFIKEQLDPNFLLQAFTIYICLTSQVQKYPFKEQPFLITQRIGLTPKLYHRLIHLSKSSFRSLERPIKCF